MLTVPHGFRQFWHYLSCYLEKKLFLLGVIVSLNRGIKYNKVTFLSFDLLQEELQQNVENMEIYHFHVLTFQFSLIYVLLKFILNSRIKEQLCSFVTALLIFIWLNFEKTEKNNVSSNLCVLNLHIGKDITSCILNIVSNNMLQTVTSRCIYHRFHKLQVTN